MKKYRYREKKQRRLQSWMRNSEDWLIKRGVHIMRRGLNLMKRMSSIRNSLMWRWSLSKIDWICFWDLKTVTRKSHLIMEHILVKALRMLLGRFLSILYSWRREHINHRASFNSHSKLVNRILWGMLINQYIMMTANLIMFHTVILVHLNSSWWQCLADNLSL